MGAMFVSLRRAVMEDLPFIMATERQPGFEWLLGQNTADEHAQAMALPANAYLLGLDLAGAPQGFAILKDLLDPQGNVYLQRIAVALHGQGFGRGLLASVVDFAFATTAAHRFWLYMKAGNDRAHHVYLQSGFTEEGRLRQAMIAPDGGRMDSHVFSMLRPEWSSRSASATT
jgi:RimJ/RimL family protein N-acetyltransferase